MDLQISLILLLPDSVGLRLYCPQILGDFVVVLLLFLLEGEKKKKKGGEVGRAFWGHLMPRYC